MGRIIGIRHLIKKTKDGKARPTQICVWITGGMGVYELDDETAELDWVKGSYPLSYRKAEEGEDLSMFTEHHIKRTEKRVMVPDRFDGLKPGDKVVMILGGSGDRMAYAISRRGVDIGARVFRIPPARFTERRASNDKKEDAMNLVKIFSNSPELFYEISPRDRALILTTELYRARIEAMKERIACEQRLFQSLNDRIFLNPDGFYPEGTIEQAFDTCKANDVILKNLAAEEKKREKELVDVLKTIPVYESVFEPIEGMGPLIAARIIVAIGDIRRFSTKGKLKAYCGVHVLPDGSFPRKRSGHVANWNNDARTAFFLCGDQFNRRTESEWGKKLLAYKVQFRAKHSEVKTDNGKGITVSKYSKGHTLKMAKWRTVTKLCEYIWSKWWELERASSAN